MPESEDEFEKTVSEFLSEGLHIRRGLTAEAYTALCRKAWDECRTSPDFPIKVLVDPIHSIESMFANSAREYVHWRAVDTMEALKDPSLEIRCEAMGLVKPDLTTGPDDRPPLPADDEPDTPEMRRYLLAVFDVLGFSALLNEKGLSEINVLYSRLIAEAVTKEAMRTYTIIRLSKTRMASVWGALPVSHAHFSDTIFLWVPLVQHFIAPFMARCADMVCEALKMGIPLRGALAAGQAVMHARTGTFVGAPIVEAARLEQSQDWLGVSLGASMLAADISCEFDPNLVVPYAVPFKKGKERIAADIALDWPSRFRARYGTDPMEAVRAVDRSPLHHIYYDNAVRFAEFTAGPLYRSDGLHPPRLGELADATLDARRKKTPLGQHHQFALKDLSRSGADGDAVARFLRAVAASEDLPPIPDLLPPGLRKYLRDLSLAARENGRFFNLVPCTIEAVCMHLCGTTFSAGIDGILTELEQLAPDGRRVAKFLRDLAAGGSPAVPGKLSRGTGPFLKQALTWVTNGKVPSGLVRHVAQKCLETRMESRLFDESAPLDETMVRALAAIEATGGKWVDVAAFLRAIAAGADPVVPAGMPEPIHSDLVRLSLTSRAAGVQSPRINDIIAVGFGDPATGIDLFSLVHALRTIRGHVTELPEEAERAITEFEQAHPERAPVAQRLRALITNEPASPAPERLPVAIRLFLTQLEAVAAGKPIPLDPSLVGLAAIRMRHGGEAMGDCIMFSLYAMAMSRPEAKTLASYLLTIAKGGPAGPAPVLADPHLAATAEEVRCLAEKQVGGIRMMMKPASKTVPRLSGL